MKLKEKRLSHELLVHMVSIIDVFDELDADSSEAREIKNKIDPLIPLLEKQVNALYDGSEELRETDYVQGIQNRIKTEVDTSFLNLKHKIKTIMRRNFKNISK